jgi:uncharacterized protein YidB (DUF937 family)
MDLEKVAAAGFIDELQKIFEGMGPSDREKVASAFHERFLGDASLEQVAAMLKEAGFFDRVKSFVGGGNENGIPMHSLGSMMSQSNPLTGMGSSLAGSARAAGGAIANKLQAAGGAVGNFLRGGTNAQGIPMQGLGQMMAQSNPFHGMGSSLAQNVPGAARAMAGGAGRLMGGGGMHPAMAH